MNYQSLKENFTFYIFDLCCCDDDGGGCDDNDCVQAMVLHYGRETLLKLSVLIFIMNNIQLYEDMQMKVELHYRNTCVLIAFNTLYLCVLNGNVPYSLSNKTTQSLRRGTEEKP